MDPSDVNNKPDFIADSTAQANEENRNAAVNAAAKKASAADSEANNINANYNSNVKALDNFAISRNPSDLGSISDKYSNVVKSAKAVDDAKALQKELIADVKTQTAYVKQLNDQLNKSTDRRSHAFKNRQKQLQTAKRRLESIKKTAMDAADKVADAERNLKGNIAYAKLNEEREKNAKTHAAESAAIQATAAETARKELAENGLLDPIRTEAGVEQKRLRSLAFASKRSRRKSS